MMRRDADPELPPAAEPRHGHGKAAQAREVIKGIVEEIDRIDAPDCTKRALRQFINKTCLAHGITVIDRAERVQFARRLLNDREPRATIRERLMNRFGVSRSQAYRIIDGALMLSPKASNSGTETGQTGTTGKPP